MWDSFRINQNVCLVMDFYRYTLLDLIQLPLPTENDIDISSSKALINGCIIPRYLIELLLLFSKYCGLFFLFSVEIIIQFRFHRETKTCFDLIDFAKLKKVAVNLAGALWILRSEGIIHCDIKPGNNNILLKIFLFNI